MERLTDRKGQKRRHNVVECVCVQAIFKLKTARQSVKGRRRLAHFLFSIPPSIPTLPILWMLLLFLHVVMSPPLLSFPRARKRVLLAPSQITQSISSESRGGLWEVEGGRQTERGGGIGKNVWNREKRKEGGGVKKT